MQPGRPRGHALCRNLALQQDHAVDMRSSGVLEGTVLVYGQMSEGQMKRTAGCAVTRAVGGADHRMDQLRDEHSPAHCGVAEHCRLPPCANGLSRSITSIPVEKIPSPYSALHINRFRFSRRMTAIGTRTKLKRGKATSALPL